MRKQRNMVWTDSPYDHYEGEEVEEVAYDIDAHGVVTHLRMFAAQSEVEVLDRHPLMRLSPSYADERDGRVVTLARQATRPMAPPSSPPPGDDFRPGGRITGYKEPLTVIEQLATPWYSTYGHAPGESWGRSFTLCIPLPVRYDDRVLVFGRFLAWQAMEIRERVGADQPSLRAFLEWVGGPGLNPWFGSVDVSACWRANGVPHVVMCVREAAHRALLDAVAAACRSRLVEEFAANKKPEGDHYRDTARYLLAESLDRSGAMRGTHEDRIFAAAAYTLLGKKRWSDARMALARKGCRMREMKDASDIVNGLHLPGEDLRLYREAMDRLRSA